MHKKVFFSYMYDELLLSLLYHEWGDPSYSTWTTNNPFFQKKKILNIILG